MIEEIKNRLLEQNKNWLAIITGGTGSGKSWSALRLAEMIDPDFNITKVCFTSKDFMKTLNSDKIKKGACIVFDEAGVGIPSREWYSVSNKLINYVLQTFRHRNLAVIFTTPSFEFIDSQARKLFHFYFETMKIYRRAGVCILKPLMIQHNPRLGKTYFKYPEYPEGLLKRLKVHKPSHELIMAYERKKKLFSKKLGEDIEETLAAASEKERKSKPLTDEECIKIIKKKLKGEKVTASKIRSVVPVSYHRAEELRDKIKRTY